MIQASFLGCIN